MNRDRLILVAVFFAGLIGYIFDEEGDLYPLIVLGAALSVFHVERLLIGRALSFSAMTLPATFLLGFVVILFLGMVVMWNAFDSEVKTDYLNSLAVTLVTFPIGVWLANVATANAFNLQHGSVWDVGRSPVDEAFATYCLALLLISLFSLALFFGFSEHVQLIDFLTQSDTALDPDYVRFAQTALPKPVQYLFEITRRVLLPICVLYSYFMRAWYGGRWKIFFPTLFVFALLVSLLTLDRSPPMGLMAMLVIAFALRGGKIGIAQWVAGVVFVAAALVLAGWISIFQYQSVEISWTELAETTWYVATYRIFWSPQEMALRVYDAFNYDTYFLHGEYVRLLSFLPGHEYAESAASNVDPLVAAPVTFVGDLWRNFGWVGIVMGAACYGFLFQIVQVSLFDRVTVLRAPIYVLLLLGSLAIIHGNALGVVTLSVIMLGAIIGFFVRKFEVREEALLKVGNSSALPVREDA